MKNAFPNQVAEIQLSYKSRVKPSERTTIRDSKTAYQVLYSTWDLSTIELCEHFKVLLLNQANHVLGLYTVSAGGVSKTIVDIKLIFTAALLAKASGLVLAHNHPSGKLQPSDEDLQVTRRIHNAADFLDLRLLDHLIITKESYYSFEENGLL